MADLKLIYFEGCPNYLPAVNLLKEAGLDFEVVCQDQLEESDQLKNFSSPTLLKGDTIVFGAEAKGGGCSMPLPTKEKLLQRISGS